MDTVLAAGGGAGRLMRDVRWESTPLGAMSGWPQSLRSAVSICLLSRFPICLWWGPELVLLYNDAYLPILGNKQPLPMGRPGHEVWAEIWPTIGPMLNGVMATGEATWSDDQLLFIDRSGYSEEGYFTFSYSPISDENGGVGGIFCAVNETTQRVIGARRLSTLSRLAERTISAISAEEACVRAAEVLADNSADVPFSLVYLLDGPATTPECVASAGDASPVADMRLPLSTVIETGTVQKIAVGQAEDAPRTALVLPIPQPGAATAAGVLVAGVSPRRALDADYQRFFELVARQLGTAVADAVAYEAERKRAEALAELDRAKTTFFSNVSHEFRTPLTLLLGPLEQAMARVPDDERVDMEIAHRNALRLLKLTNALLDFSRIEAGRIDASYEPVDLSLVTADLASTFRSAVEAGGLRLVVDTPGLAEDAYIDREMWEKIVLNLISNAFKFTFEGEIAVRTRLLDESFELVVSDTGIGVPGDELPRLFDRFYRVRGSRSRSHEGSGIGLALVNELVHLHGGAITVESEAGAGTTFTVTIPRGSAHLPQDHVRSPRGLSSTAVGAAPFVEEARRWLPDAAVDVVPMYSDEAGLGEVSAGPTSGARVLIVDDNADMRAYLMALLSPHWKVETATDGRAALERAVKSPPDLILTDVMMPGMDGLELLAALRADEGTRHVPVVMLSARAGEEARVEGLESGADDYLVKPFAARELIARVRANLELSAMRLLTSANLREAERLRTELDRAAQLEKTKAEFLRLASHELRAPLTVLAGYTALIKNGALGEVKGDLETVIPIMDRKVLEMRALVEQMLETARLEDNRLALAVERVDLRDVVARAVETMSPLVPARHRMSVAMPDEGVPVDCDVSRVATVIGNLIDNAIRYSPAGGRVSVKCAIRPRSRRAFVQVRDEGLGIAANDLPRLFTRFGRIVTRENSHISGTGLGLYLSNELIRMHGGRITVRSTPEKGSTFTVMLPLADAAVVPIPPPRRRASDGVVAEPAPITTLDFGETVPLEPPAESPRTAS